MQLNDRTVVITGAARGLGAAMAERLAGEHANLALLDMDAAGLEAIQAKCASHGIDARAYTLNVADEDQVVNAYAQIAADFGTVDASIANAGILRDALLVKASNQIIESQMSLQDWQAVVDVNLTGVFLCGREAAKQMIQTNTMGCIINISSVSRAGNFGQSNYSAAKAGVAALTVVWAKELSRYGIRSNAIAPGLVATEIVSNMKPVVLEKMASTIPAGRLGAPEEIADTVIYLLKNDYVNGRVIEVDGGLRL